MPLANASIFAYIIFGVTLVELLSQHIFYQRMDDSGNWPDDPGNVPVKAQKAPDQIQAGDSWPVNGHNSSCSFIDILRFILLVWHIAAANGALTVQVK